MNSSHRTAMSLTQQETKITTPKHCPASESHLLPSDSFDTHVHVFDPRLGSYATGRAYTPDDAPLESLLAFNKNISITGKLGKIVLVQPSPYKTDCTVLMRCLQGLQREGHNAYGIAVINVDTVSDHMLRGMHKLGVRGIRLNFQADGKEFDVLSTVIQLQKAAQRICHLPGWMIQLFVPSWTWDIFHGCIRTLPVPVIADHLGGILGPSKLPPQLRDVPLSQPGFHSLLSLAKQSRVFIKISGLYRVSALNESHFDDARPIIQALAREVPCQLIWGSDWPHTGDGSNRLNRDINVKEPFQPIDNEAILRNVKNWLTDEAWQKMLKDNPGRIFH